MKKQLCYLWLLVLPATLGAQITTGRPNSTVVSTVIPVKKAKFVLTCNASNLTGLYDPVTNYVPGNHYREVIIDHRLCNNNPDAFMLVTPVRNLPVAFSVYYDNNLNRWKIRIESNGVSEYHTGHASPADKNPIMVTVLDYSPKYLAIGDKFNIIIDNE